MVESTSQSNVDLMEVIASIALSTTWIVLAMVFVMVQSIIHSNVDLMEVIVLDVEYRNQNVWVMETVMEGITILKSVDMMEVIVHSQTTIFHQCLVYFFPVFVVVIVVQVM